MSQRCIKRETDGGGVDEGGVKKNAIEAIVIRPELSCQDTKQI